MHSLEIFTIGNGALAVAVGTFAIWKFPQNRINRTFAFVALAVAIWTGAHFLPLAEKYLELSALGGATLFAATNFHFARNLIGGAARRKFVVPTIYFANFILFGLLATDRLGFFEIFAIDKIWFAGFLVTIVAPIFLLGKSIRIFAGVKKYQLKFILFEYLVALALAFGLLAYFWKLGNSLAGNLASVPHFLGGLHLLVIFYFFVEWKFLKLKIIAPKILKRAVALVVALGVSIPLNFFEIGHSALLNRAVSVVIAVAIYALALRFFEKWNWFTTVSLNNFRRVIEEFKNQNIFYRSLAELEANIRENFSRKIGIESARVVVLDLDGGAAKYPELEKYFAKKRHYLVTTEEEYLAKNKNVACPYLAELEKLGDVCFPLFQNTNELIGFFVVRRAGDDIYIEEELKLLESGVHYIALSLVAILYTEKLRQQAEKLREDYEKLKTLDDAKDAFIANVSHELRTPASAIRGYSEMLAAPNFGKLSEKQKDFTERIAKNTNWLLTILGDILEITKLESEQIKFNFVKIDARELLEKSAEKWRKKCAEKGLEFDFNFAIDAASEIRTDAAKLDEVLERLLGNAVKFTEKGGIEMSARADGEFLKIEIADTGIGIAAEKLVGIWDKFSQSADFLEKGDESSGLGLAIVKKLVENLGGEIAVKSELKKGSRFEILIPRQNE